MEKEKDRSAGQGQEQVVSQFGDTEVVITKDQITLSAHSLNDEACLTMLGEDTYIKTGTIQLEERPITFLELQ